MFILEAEKFRKQSYQQKQNIFPFSITVWFVIILQALGKPRKMGCVDSQPDFVAQDCGGEGINIICEKMIEIENPPLTGKRQDLSVSDYEAFLKKSKEQNKIEYPSAFQFVHIRPIPDSQLTQILKEDVPPLNCTRTQLVNLCVSMIMENSFALQNLNREHLRSLVAQIADNYNSVSYHNFSHGFALMQMLYKCFKLEAGLGKIYSPQDLTYYLIAGITHDVNHRGTNNIFEQKMKSQLAKLAENDAILQKMHIRTFFHISKSRPEFDVIAKSANPLQTKQKMTRVILATDMKKHFTNLKLIEDRKKQGKLDFTEEQTKIVFMENLVHACDIGNSLLPYQQYINWGGLLTYEFNEQTKLEAANNVPVTQFLRYKGLVSFYDDQIGFLGTFVIPLWKEISVIFSGIENMYKNSVSNLGKIKELKQAQTK